MYSVDSTALDNSTYGWRLMRPTRPLLNLVMERPNVGTPGTPGVVPGLPASLTPPVLTFVVTTPLAGLQALESLWLHGTRLTYTGDSSKVAEFEFLSMSHTTYGPKMEMVRLDVTIRLAEVFWRDAATSTTPLKALSSASVFVDAWPGTSGIIRDAVVRVRGPVEGLQVRSGPAWFSAPMELDSGQYLRFDVKSGRAFITSSDTWGGGSEVSGSVDFAGPDGLFAIFPNVTNPSSRAARVEVTTTSRAAGAAAQLRGKGSYLA